MSDKATKSEFVKPEEFIVGNDIGLIRTDGDPKQKWFVRLFVNRNQQIGWLVLLALTVLTFCYFRTYGWAGLWPTWHTDTQVAAQATQPIVLYPRHEGWSLPTYLGKQPWRFATEPLDAVLEAQNDTTKEVVLLEGMTAKLPPTWTKVRWKMAGKDRREYSKLTLTPMH